MPNEINAREVFEDIVDRLIPAKELDAYEQAIYYFLVRESRLRGSAEAQVSFKSLAAKLFMTRSAIVPRLRSLQTKGCIETVDTGWSGRRVRVALPTEILGARGVALQPALPDVETIDFFTDGKHRDAILEREGHRCFYCLRVLTKDNWSLDHVEPQIASGQNGYRNIVAACHSCNSLKNATGAEDFLRDVYRRGRLSDSDLEGRFAALEALRRGESRPVISAL
jgi:hypothetical protein